MDIRLITWEVQMVDGFIDIRLKTDAGWINIPKLYRDSAVELANAIITASQDVPSMLNRKESYGY